MTARGNAPGPLPEQHARLLAQRLLDDQLCLFVGAGLSHLAPAKDGSDRRLPLWGELARQVEGKSGQALDDFDGDVLDLFDSIVHEQSRGDLERMVRECLPEREFVPSTAHKALEKLHWTAILTTNYDALRCAADGPAPITAERQYDRLSVSAAERPRLFQLHGTLEHPHTLTRQDYELWEEKHPRALAHLKQLVLEKTVLFVGYSLSDPHFRTLLATIQKITAGQEKRLHGWFWKIREAKADLLDRRDKIEAIRIEREEDWAAAFRQVEAALAARRAEEEAKTAKTAGGRIAVSSPEPAVALEDDRYARAQYLRAVQAHHGLANLHGFQLGGIGLAQGDVRLEEVFVEPDLVRRSTAGAGKGSSDLLNEAEEMEKVEESEALANLSTALRERSRSFENEEGGRGRGGEVVQREPALALLRREPRALVVGAPAQGKSTLLRRWLLEVTERWQERPEDEPVPIYLRLAEWEASPGPAAGRLLRSARERLPQLGEIPSDAVERWLRGPVLWLLDGIDEIRDPAERARLQDELAATAAQRPEDRWVVSTRPAGEPSGGLGSGFVRTELPDLAAEQVAAVLERWEGLLEARGDCPFEARELAGSLHRTPGLATVARNALFLTLIVLFYARQRRLPHDRWEFYGEAESLLRDAWARHRLQRAGDHLPSGYLPQLLERLALDGMERGRVVWSRAELGQVTARFLEERGYTGREREQEVGRFLAAAEDLIGVLVAQGPERFGFLHLTFQEYFAARALVNHSGVARGFIARFWDHPDWREVWPLYAVGVQKDPARLEELFRTIRETAHPLDEELLFRDRLARLRLAGVVQEPLPEVAQEVVDWGRAVLEEPSLSEVADEIATTLGRWERQVPVKELVMLSTDDRSKVRRLAVRALASAALESAVQPALLARLEDKERYVRRAAVDSLSSAASSPGVQVALLARLKDEDLHVRWAAAEALSSVASAPGVQAALLARLDDEDGEVRRAAVGSLSSVASSPGVQAALLARLKDEDSRARWSTAKLLSSVASAPGVQAALLARLDDEDGEVRRTAAESLSSVASAPVVQTALLARLEDEDLVVRSAAAGALSSVASETVVQAALLVRLEDEYWRVRRTAIDSLSLVASETGVQAALLARLKDEDLRVVWAAARSLSSVALELVAEAALLSLLEDQGEGLPAAASLISVASSPGVQAVLLARLEAEDPYVRSIAAESLSSAASEPVVQAALLARLEDEDWRVRHAAAESLSSVAGESRVRQALVDRLRREKDDWVRRQLREALAGPIAKERREALS